MSAMEYTNQIIKCFDTTSIVFVSLLLITLAAMVFSVFKAKGKVKAFGHVALILSIIDFLSAISRIIEIRTIETNNRPMEIAETLLPAAIILFIGLTIYLLSVILRIIQSPRI